MSSSNCTYKIAAENNSKETVNSSFLDLSISNISKHNAKNNRNNVKGLITPGKKLISIFLVSIDDTFLITSHSSVKVFISTQNKYTYKL